MEKHLMKGAEAIAEAAVLAGCRQFFGYQYGIRSRGKRSKGDDELLKPGNLP